MTVSYITITPHDPVIARDSRPFGLSLRMKSLDWPYPSLIAGSLRTALAKMHESDFMEPDTLKNLKEVSVHGALPVIGGQLFFPAPKDILVRKNEGKESDVFPIRPTKMEGDEGCDLPKGIYPAMLSSAAEDEFKPDDIAAFWSLTKIAEWLTNPHGSGFKPPYPQDSESISHGQTGSGINKSSATAGTTVSLCVSGLDLPKKDSRIQTAISPLNGVAEESKFFETIGLDLIQKNCHYPVGLSVRTDIPKPENPYYATKFDGFSPLGAERRLSYWKTEDKMPVGWECPDLVKDALQTATKIRMILATPAFFTKGWQPGWLKEETVQGLEEITFSGTPPGAPAGLKLRLISACIDRWKPVSGFSLEHNNEGPKPLRRIVPAGSVYFFHIVSGKAGDLASCWLKPVSDDSTDPNDHFAQDGFGLALWGVWDEENAKKSIELEKV